MVNMGGPLLGLRGKPHLEERSPPDPQSTTPPPPVTENAARVVLESSPPGRLGTGRGLALPRRGGGGGRNGSMGSSA